MIEVDLGRLDYDERESLYIELETRYVDYTWFSELSYSGKYKKFVYKLIGYQNE